MQNDGLFLEYHDFSQTITPLHKDCGGFVVLGRSLANKNKNFKPNVISESSPNNNYTSYSINKGEKLVFCIRKKRGSHANELMDLNTMMFVAIHELAHLMTKSVGHTPEFWANMKFLLQQAIKEDVSVYEEQDFSNNPEQYCGMTITDSPLYS